MAYEFPADIRDRLKAKLSNGVYQVVDHSGDVMFIRFAAPRVLDEAR